MDFFQIHKKIIYFCSLSLIIGFIALRYYYNKESLKDEEIVRTSPTTESVAEELITIDLKGEVLNPGVYTVPANTIVKDLIALAGGLTDDANTETINLAASLADGMMIVVPKQGQGSATNDPFTNTPNRISLNNATLAELQSLPGIGLNKAQKIIDYRQTYGPFKNINEIQNVSGIGSQTYEKIKEYLTL